MPTVAVAALVAAAGAATATLVDRERAPVSSTQNCRDTLARIDAGTKVGEYQSELASSCESYGEFSSAFKDATYPFASGVLLVFCSPSSVGDTPSDVYGSELCQGARVAEPLLRVQPAAPDPSPTLALATPLKSYINFDQLGVFFNRIHRTPDDPRSITGTLSNPDGMPLVNCRMTADLTTPNGPVQLTTPRWLDSLFAITPGEEVEIVLSHGVGLQDTYEQATLDGSDFWGIQYELSCDPGGE